MTTTASRDRERGRKRERERDEKADREDEKRAKKSKSSDEKKKSKKEHKKSSKLSKKDKKDKKKHHHHDDDKKIAKQVKKAKKLLKLVSQTGGLDPNLISSAAAAAGAAVITAPSSSSSSSFSSSHPPPPTLLTEDSYFEKATEFRLWLQQQQPPQYIDELPSEVSRARFRDFIDAWNHGRLAASFYAGIDSSRLESKALTRHKWGFASKLDASDEWRLANLRDTVDTSTHHHSYEQEFGSIGAAVPVAAASSSSLAAPAAPTTTTDAYTRHLAAQRHREAVQLALDEVAPKETGREAQREKRLARSAYTRPVEDDGLDMGDAALGGGGASEFEQLRARERARQQRRDDERQQRVDAYQQKEKEKMKAMLASIGMADKYPID